MQVLVLLRARSPDLDDAVEYAYAIKHVPGMGIFEFYRDEAARVAALKGKR